MYNIDLLIYIYYSYIRCINESGTGLTQSSIALK